MPFYEIEAEGKIVRCHCEDESDVSGVLMNMGPDGGCFIEDIERVVIKEVSPPLSEEALLLANGWIYFKGKSYTGLNWIDAEEDEGVYSKADALIIQQARNALGLF
jgi:hypothetical protein